VSCSIRTVLASLTRGAVLFASALLMSAEDPASRSLQPVPAYTVVDLGTLGGTGIYEYSFSTGINNLGQVIGNSRISTGQHRAFRTGPNLGINPSTDNLGTLGGNDSFAFGINEHGQVVGWSNVLTGWVHAFYWDGALVDLGTLGGPMSAATAINERGQVVGWAHPPVGNIRPFRTAGHGSLINPLADDLGTTTATNECYAYAINDAGWVAGYGYDSVLGRFRAFRIAPNGTLSDADDLGTFGGLAKALGIDAAGRVVGFSYKLGPGGVFYEAFRTAAGPKSFIEPTSDLGLTGDSSDSIHTSPSGRYVVGNSSSHSYYLYTSGVVYPLRTLIPASSGFRLFYVSGVNDKGQISGAAATQNGSVHAIRMDPN
jgi:probable HAF family extracellular repeat protein